MNHQKEMMILKRKDPVAYFEIMAALLAIDGFNEVAKKYTKAANCISHAQFTHDNEVSACEAVTLAKKALAESRKVLEGKQ